jgi:Na+-driven multidrug efflux pump
MNNRLGRNCGVAVALALLALPAHAYLGPGMGIGAFGVFLGIIVSFLVAVFSLIWFPIKRRIRAKKMKASAEAQTETEAPDNACHQGHEAADNSLQARDIK